MRAVVFSRSWLAGELFAPTLPRVDRRVAGARHIGASRAHDPVTPRPQPAAPSRASSAVAIATRRATHGSNAVQFMFAFLLRFTLGAMQSARSPADTPANPGQIASGPIAGCASGEGQTSRCRDTAIGRNQSTARGAVYGASEEYCA